jgi:PiT family inorganic phosphate transporter
MNPIVIILLIVAFALAFGIGANDESMSTAVGSRAINLKTAVILGGILSFIGCFFLSSGVGKTIGASMLGETVEYNTSMMLAVILSTAIWLIVASRTGAPISTTHSVVGSIFGISIVWAISTSQNYFSSINWSKIMEVVLGWVISPAFGFIGALFIQWILDKILSLRSNGLLQIEKTEKTFIYILLATVCLTQISRGGNDAANAIGVFYGLFESEDANPGSGLSSNYELLLLGITGVMISLGLIIIGRNVIKMVGGSINEMRPSGAFAISFSTTIVILLATVLGLPVSGSHILIFAILGSGWLKGEKPDKKSFRKMVSSWLLTFPVAATLSALFYASFLPFT